MGLPRVAVAAALVVALVAGGVALAAWERAPARGGGDAGAFDVLVAAPDRVLFDGSVDAPSNATALSLLELAASRGNFTVDTVEYPGMGTYVRAVGGYAAHGASGWIFEVRRDGAWVPGDRSAGRFAMHAGDALRWSWTDGGG